jgi:hypothetical protein
MSQQSPNEEAEPKNGVAMRAGVHDFFLHDADHFFVDAVGMIARFPLGMFERDDLLAVRTLCHFASSEIRALAFECVHGDRRVPRI